MPPSKLLYVEDDPEHRELLAAFLSASGYRVTTACTAAEATAALDVDEFDLILADVTLPDVDGWHVAAAARARRPGARVVMLTGWSDAPRGREVAVDEVLTKPVAPLDLLSRLRAPPRRAP